MKHLNILIFLLLSAVFLLFSSHIKFSTNFLELFFSKESVELFSVIKKLELSSNIYVAKKGFSDDSLDELYLVAKKLEKFPEISEVTISLLPSKKLKEYYKQNYYLLADFNDTKLTKVDIAKKLFREYENLQNSFIYIPIDTNDPLGLFKAKIFPHAKYLKLKDYGYVFRAKTDIDTSSAKVAGVLHAKIQHLLVKHKDMIAYAPFFFLVENSSYIQNDTQKIVIVATVLLLILYFFMLKSYKILFHTIIAIASSVLSAILVSSLFFESINVMILAFGVSITTVSIDYMFHYYFHGNFSKKGFIRQKKVFFGFITTFGVFVIFSFIDVKLFNQLAFFSAVSLLSAFLIFSWAFGYLEIEKPVLNLQNIKFKSFNPLYIVLISFVLFGYSYKNLKFDNNLRNLDYKNEKLLALSEKFREGLAQSSYQNVIISADTEELLLQKYEKLQKLYPDMLGVGKFIFSKKKCQERLQKIQAYDFKRVKTIIDIESKKVGFGESFKKSYAGVENIKCQMKLLKEMGFKIIKDTDKYYTLALIPHTDKVIFGDGVELLDITKTLSKDMQKSKESIVKFMFLSIVFIIVILFLVSGMDVLYPLAFVLFPISIVLFFISLFGTINIMHLFGLIILMAISIDYGVYMHNTKSLVETTTAIRYALLSTLAGFGVLIFSDTVALNSIGFVISVGIGAIFILLYGRRYEDI